MKQEKIKRNKTKRNVAIRNRNKLFLSRKKVFRNQASPQEPLAWVGSEPEKLVAERQLQSKQHQKQKAQKRETELFKSESGPKKRTQIRTKSKTSERPQVALLKKLVITRSCCGKQFGMKQAGLGFLLGMPLGFLTGYILFQRLPLELVLLLVGGLIGARVYPAFLIEKREQAFRLQFCDYLDAVSMSLACGRNTYDTFLSASADMRTLYAEDAPICLAGEYIAGNLMAGEPLASLLETVAKESHCEDVETFGNVYLICEQAGGNLKQVVDQSRNMLTEKISIEAEISVLLAGPKNELYVMTGMPLVILTAMKLLSTDLFTAEHLAINLFALALFTFAFLLGRNMVKIRV